MVRLCLCRSWWSCFRGWCWLVFSLRCFSAGCFFLSFLLLLFKISLLFIELLLLSAELFESMISFTSLGCASYSDSLWVDCTRNTVLCLYVELWYVISCSLWTKITLINTSVIDILTCWCLNHVLDLVPLYSFILRMICQITLPTQRWQWEHCTGRVLPAFILLLPLFLLFTGIPLKINKYHLSDPYLI